MKVLDLFCGLGGWSDGFASEGYEVLGVEIDPKIANLYKHPVIVADVRTLNGEMFKGFDVIVGSPPCRDFSDLARFLGHTWKRPPDPEGDGMSKINGFLRIVKESQPKYWLMENVKQLQKYIGSAEVCSYLGVKHMFRCFWGCFPAFLIPQDASKIVYKSHWHGKRPTITGDGGPLKSWQVAKIPFPVARALAEAIKNNSKG
ncbi:hypothetical protein ES703_121900 [subsurface metagenome]